MRNILCRVERLSVAYRTPAGMHSALKSVSLDIMAGEKLAIIGESGSGKSTLALALTGLLPAEALIEGEIVWTGPGSAPLPGRDIGIVFQDPGSSLNPVLTIGEQVGEGARHHLGLGRRAARDKAIELLARVRLPHPEQAVGAYPHQFSGGQRQRIAIAAAIAAGPSVLIADEATSALDTIVQAEIAALLEDLVQTGQMTLIFVTHDIGLAASLADRIAVFRTAELVEIGDAGSIVNTPQAGYTRQLLATHIDLDSPRLVGASDVR
ncbi:ABC transporter ATP-binding protein [Hoeflea sp.]|uniref:ATP-binding cassette domain-containing protein n=1 Tax=Hoeflea sp. TaxID=1940281 RepID=UPI0025C31F60|nr:ABC transporter ATP-binding protein [Hoeflea sp.]